MFTENYLTLASGFLSQCHLETEVSLSDYNHCLSKGANQQPLKRLPPHQFLYGLVHTESKTLVSVLHLVYLYGCMGGAEPGPQHILQWSYAYTLDDKKYRRQGCSLALRLASMIWAQQQGWNYINSVPLPGAHSEPLLKSLGFTPFYDGDDDIYYIYQLSKTNLSGLAKERLMRK